MEKLPKQQQENIRKMSTDRLRLNLLRVGNEEEAVLAMDRDTLLNAWAELVVAGKEKPQAAAGATARTAGYDVELEREKLAFEKLRHEQELAVRKQELQQQAERDKKEAEMKATELQLRAEKDKKDAELKERELEQKAARDKADLERQDAEARRLASKEAAERAKAESVVARLKTFGDALKNSITIQPADPFENIAFFRNVENIFDVLHVPSDLRGTLLRPYLNEKSKSLVGRMDATDAADYEKVKSLLLKEYKMSPAMYKETFNTLSKTESETYTLYASRLKAVLSYYVDSRHVKTLDEFQDLMVCDRIKTTLSDNCLRHVLSVESSAACKTGWLNSTDLASTIDCYLANHVGDRPRSAALGNSANRNVVQTTGNRNQARPINYSSNVSSPVGHTTATVAASSDRKQPCCYICHSPSHLKAHCPQRKTDASRPQAQNSHSTTVRKTSACTASKPRQYHTDNETRPADCAPAHVNAPAQPSAATVVCTAEEASEPMNENAGNHVVPTASATEVTVDETDSVHDSYCANDFAQLHYLQVRVSSLPNDDKSVVVTALDDGGAEVAVANTNTINSLDNVEHIGTIKLKGVIGASVTATLVRLYICLADDNDCMQWIPIMCAVHDEANDQLVLNADQVSLLHSPRHKFIVYDNVDNADNVIVNANNVVTVDDSQDNSTDEQSDNDDMQNNNDTDINNSASNNDVIDDCVDPDATTKLDTLDDGLKP